MMPEKTVWFPAGSWSRFAKFYKDYEQFLNMMEIDNEAKLIRWCANLGAPVAEAILKNMAVEFEKHLEANKKYKNEK